MLLGGGHEQPWMSSSLLNHPTAALRLMTRPTTAMARSAGFTLLETMVAMVVFAGAAMALYALFNTNLTALGRVHDASRQMTAARHAIEHLVGINPRETSTGAG